MVFSSVNSELHPTVIALFIIQRVREPLIMSLSNFLISWRWYWYMNITFSDIKMLNLIKPSCRTFLPYPLVRRQSEAGSRFRWIKVVRLCATIQLFLGQWWRTQRTALLQLYFYTGRYVVCTCTCMWLMDVVMVLKALLKCIWWV